MTHFTLEQWADFARQNVSPAEGSKMQQHLKDGCSQCAETLELIRKVADLAGREGSYEPPQESLRFTKSLFSSIPSRTTNMVQDFMELMFDSFMQPQAAGIRAALVSSRQLLYRKGDCCIDMRIEHAAGAKDAILIGQVLDSGEQNRGVGSILVQLMSGETVIANTATTSHGEFQFQFMPADSLQLCFGVSSQNCFWIKIPPLETLPESASLGD